MTAVISFWLRHRSTLHLIESAAVLLSPIVIGFIGWQPYVVLAIVWLVDVLLYRAVTPPEPDDPSTDIRSTYNVPSYSPLPTIKPPKAEDPEATHLRIQRMWPEGRRHDEGPVSAPRRVRRPSPRVREVIAGWQLPSIEDAGNLPF